MTDCFELYRINYDRNEDFSLEEILERGPFFIHIFKSDMEMWQPIVKLYFFGNSWIRILNQR